MRNSAGRGGRLVVRDWFCDEASGPCKDVSLKVGGQDGAAGLVGVDSPNDQGYQ